MKRHLSTTLLAVSALVLLGACAEVDESGGIGYHPNGWISPGASQSHKVALAEAGLPNSVEACAECHGADYGIPDMECFGCHASGQEFGHPTSGFVGPSGANFHGQVVIDSGGTDSCSHCHAWEAGGKVDLDLGGWSQQPCDSCHAGGRSGHPGFYTWLIRDSGDFHGDAAAGGMITDCSQCHGADYLGGWTGVSCNYCHPSNAPIHPAGTWVGSKATEGTHGWLISNGEIEVDDCLACHGADYMGGWTQQSCLTCHPGFGGGAVAASAP